VILARNVLKHVLLVRMMVLEAILACLALTLPHYSKEHVYALMDTGLTPRIE
jgi:hypothetical protein